MIASLPTSQKLDKNKSKTKTRETDKVKKREDRREKRSLKNKRNENTRLPKKKILHRAALKKTTLGCYPQ